MKKTALLFGISLTLYLKMYHLGGKMYHLIFDHVSNDLGDTANLVRFNFV